MNLERFGFTPTETKAYQALLRLGAATGYALARDLGIARANAYQALEGLVRRGAARRAATIPSQFSAIPPASLVMELERVFHRDLLALKEAFGRLPPPTPSPHVELEALVSNHDLLASATAAADAAASELLVVTGPWAGPVNAALERAVARGLALRAISLGASGPRNAAVRQVPEGELRAYWGGLPIALVADRTRAVWGVLTGEESASGMATTLPGAVPFLRHLLRRELASASGA